MTPRLLLCLAIALFSATVHGDDTGTLKQLVRENKLQISSELDPASAVVPGQKVLLRITIATDRWFAGGTRITVPEIPGVIALQSEVFARNSSERRDGVSWVVQQWILDLYPTTEGRFNTGPITVALQINTESGIVKGNINAPAVTLAATKPPQLDAPQWLAAPAFSAQQQISGVHEQLEPGAAIVRTITLEARDVLDKMLPEINTGKQPGLAAYARPAELETRNNRGQNLVSRRQQITYIAEQPGQYQLPGYRFAWWNTEQQQLQWVTLDSIDLNVGGSPVATSGSPTSARGQATVLIALLVGLLLLTIATRHWFAWQKLYAAGSRISQRGGSLWQQLRSPALPTQLNPWRRKD